MAFSRTSRFGRAKRSVRVNAKEHAKENSDKGNKGKRVIRPLSARSKRARRREFAQQQRQQAKTTLCKKRKSSEMRKGSVSFGGTTARFGGRGSIYSKSAAPADYIGMSHKKGLGNTTGGAVMEKQKSERFGHGSYLSKEHQGEGAGKFLSQADLNATNKVKGGPAMDDVSKRKHRRFSMAGSHFGTLGKATLEVQSKALAHKSFIKDKGVVDFRGQDKIGRDAWMGVNEKDQDEAAHHIGAGHGSMEVKQAAAFMKPSRHRRFSCAGSYLRQAEGDGTAAPALGHSEGLYQASTAGVKMLAGKDRFERHDSHLNAGHDKDAVSVTLIGVEHQDLAEQLEKTGGGKISKIMKHSRMSMVGNNFATGGGSISLLETVSEE